MSREKVKTVSSFEADQRRKISLDARVKFADFDGEVGDLMADFALNESYMDFLLNRLNLPMPLNLDERLEVLREHAVKVGEAAFLMQIRRTMWQAVQHAERNRQEKKRAALALQNAKPAGVASPKDTPQRTAPSSPQSGRPVDSPSPSPRAKAATPPTPVKTPPNPVAPEYAGTDRRKRQTDRRSSLDRRGFPEGVAINKRSANERRKRNGGRRKTDRESLM